MSLIITQALPVTSVPIQAHVYYQWLTFCNQLTLIDSVGTWSSGVTGNDGIINSLVPNTFYTASAAFVVGDVGKYIAIRDGSNAINTTIGKITAFNSSTEVVLNTSVLFGASSTTVSYVIFDPTVAPPVLTNYFVVENVAVNQPKWQAKFLVATSINVELGFLGGWNVPSHAWSGTIPYSDTYNMFTTPTKLFLVSDPEQGWLYTWVENGANINAIWLGSLVPFHSPSIVGMPEDESYAVIFGTDGTDDVNNISRDTTDTDNFCTGESLSAGGTPIDIYMGQKRFLSSGNDSCSLAGYINPRSGENDDYEMICFHKGANQAWRGKVPGVKLMNDGITNTTIISGGTTYAIENGIGAIWNGKISAV